MDWSAVSKISSRNKNLWLTNLSQIISDLNFREIEDQAKKSIKKLKEYAIYYSDDMDIQALYAEGLAIMIRKSEREEAIKYFHLLREFCLRFPEECVIQEAYIFGLDYCFSLFTRDLINKYHEEYINIRKVFPDSEFIQLNDRIEYYCEDFDCEIDRLDNKFNATKRQFVNNPNTVNAAFLAEDFKNFVSNSKPPQSGFLMFEWSRFIEKYSDYEQLHTVFAEQLAVNMGYNDVIRLEELLLRLKVSLNIFPDNIDFVVNYAKCLGTLLIRQIAEKARG